MRKFAAFAALLCLFLAPALAQEKRSMGAHQHGHGTLNIAIEGSRVSMEFEAPGNDIVGFEQKAKTKAQRTALTTAKAQLSTPLALFRFPEAAGCAVKDVTVKIEAGNPKEDTKKAGHTPGDHNHDHSEFHAEYALECSSIANLTSIEFPYFAIFKRAEELEINIITAKGQTKFTVKGDKPKLDLAGVM